MKKERNSKPLIPEWSHKVDVTDLKEPIEVHIEATSDEAKDVARRLNLTSIDRLTAELRLARERGHVIKVDGSLEADIVQPCAVTLKPLKSSVEESFEAWFSDEDQAVSFTRERRERESGKGHAEFPILEESESPEPVIMGHIDIGELVTQYLSLAIEPYPHAEDAATDQIHKTFSGPEGGQKRKNPFEALKDLKSDLEKDK